MFVHHGNKIHIRLCLLLKVNTVTVLTFLFRHRSRQRYHNRFTPHIVKMGEKIISQNNSPLLCQQ